MRLELVWIPESTDSVSFEINVKYNFSELEHSKKLIQPCLASGSHVVFMTKKYALLVWRLNSFKHRPWNKTKICLNFISTSRRAKQVLSNLYVGLYLGVRWRHKISPYPCNIYLQVAAANWFSPYFLWQICASRGQNLKRERHPYPTLLCCCH